MEYTATVARPTETHHAGAGFPAGVDCRNPERRRSGLCIFALCERIPICGNRAAVLWRHTGRCCSAADVQPLDPWRAYRAYWTAQEGG